MRTVRPSSEAEMVALFLATEYPSPRTHQHILQVLQREGWPPSIIEQPNLRDGQENALRRSILGAYRGYGQNMDYFESLPLRQTLGWIRKKLDDEHARRRKQCMLSGVFQESVPFSRL